jgi:hypothetical protein
VRFGLARSLALLAGLLVAATAFTVLTGTTRTTQLQTVGTVSSHFVPSYDILVRPQGAISRVETASGTVQPDFLSGISGGITLKQYQQIEQVPGVQVAAPVALAGYALVVSNLGSDIPTADLARPGRQLYRVSTTWVSDAGTSRVAQPPSYVYVTPDQVRVDDSSGTTLEVTAGGKSTPVCPAAVQQAPGADPFGLQVQSGEANVCWSTTNGDGTGAGAAGNPGWGAHWVIPVLIAAVDPVAEARLDGLDKAVISGGYLSENAKAEQGGQDVVSFPVLASSASGMDEYAQTTLQELASPAAPQDITADWMAGEASAKGRTVATERTTAGQAYQALLAGMRPGTQARTGIFAYWSAGPTDFTSSQGGALTPVAVSNPASVWYAGGTTAASMDNADTQYRALTVHAPPINQFTGGIASPQLVGVFDPAKVQAFDPLSQVPLSIYQPVTATPADAASSSALHGSALLPNQNLGGLVSQPVNLITTLKALTALQNTGYYGPDVHASDPISVIRVRVAGVTGPDPVSLGRVREVAQQIALRTHLAVDIVDGSSPRPTTIDVPAGKFGQPALSLSEPWVKKGVAVAILRAVDRASALLFALILVVCVLFVGNSATAAVRGRRREFGVLACLGWTRIMVFASVLGELAVLGALAGLLAAAVALPLGAALGVSTAPGRTLLAIPVAVGVALVAGAVPAGLAAGAAPLNAIRPPVLAAHRGHHPGGITALAVSNVARVPGRALTAAVSLAAGIAALTVLTSISVAFHGAAVGTLLGNAVTVQVRAVDYVAVGTTVALGLLSVADSVYLNITERAAELATIRALGWHEPALSRLVITEGIVIGLAGALAGAGAGLAVAAQLAGGVPGEVIAVAIIATLAGTAFTAFAALLPTQALRRLPTAQLLAEE